MIFSLVSDADHCRVHLHQDVHRQDRRDHLGHRLDDRHLGHRNRHLDDQHPDHRDDPHHLDDQHQDHQGDQHLDHQDHVILGLMDALGHLFQLDHDLKRSQEFDQYVRQHQGQQDDHPLADDQHQAHHQDDPVEAELDDRYPEVAELDDQMGQDVEAVADVELLAQALQPQQVPPEFLLVLFLLVAQAQHVVQAQVLEQLSLQDVQR